MSVRVGLKGKPAGKSVLAQIQEAPKACLVWTIINRWYQGQQGVYCHKPFGEIHWHDYPPALLDSGCKTIEWNKIPAEKLQETGDALARMLELPHRRNVSEGTSRSDSGPARALEGGTAHSPMSSGISLRD